MFPFSVFVLIRKFSLEIEKSNINGYIGGLIWQSVDLDSELVFLRFLDSYAKLAPLWHMSSIIIT